MQKLLPQVAETFSTDTPSKEGLGSGALKTCRSFPAGTYRPPCVSMTSLEPAIDSQWPHDACISCVCTGLRLQGRYYPGATNSELPFFACEALCAV